MIDFLTANPYLTREEYMWKWTIPQILLASYDRTHVHYLSDDAIKNKNSIKIDSGDDLLASLGVPREDINKLKIK